MSEVICLQYEKRPSAIIALAKAFWGISRKFDPRNNISPICAVWRNAVIVPEHLNEFQKICGLEPGRGINMIYPLSFVFPLAIRVLGHSRAPLTIFRSLNTRTRIIQRREIRYDDKMNITCRMDERRIVQKGLEVDLVTTIDSSGETIWKSIQTFFYRGRYGEPDPVQGSVDMESIQDEPVIGQWFLPEGLGFRFAKISGDSNGIHYNALYAKILGFERDFAQPMLVLSKTVEGVSEKFTGDRLNICFKGPIYYGCQVTVRGAEMETGFRFDVYTEGNPRPCICGFFEKDSGQELP